MSDNNNDDKGVESDEATAEQPAAPAAARNAIPAEESAPAVELLAEESTEESAPAIALPAEDSPPAIALPSEDSAPAVALPAEASAPAVALPAEEPAPIAPITLAPKTVAAPAAPAAAPAAPAAAPAAPAAAPAAPAAAPAALSVEELLKDFKWPTDPEHANAVRLLSEEVEGIDLVPELHAAPESRALNFLLLLLVIAVGGAGMQALSHYSSPEREARLKEVAMCKVEQDTKTQLLAEKQYGALRIESEPSQAKVFQSVDGGPFTPIMGKTADGVEMAALTPTTINNLDINRTYKFKLELTETLRRFKDEGGDKKDKKDADAADAAAPAGDRPVEELLVDYRADEFQVARYQWIQDGATGAFRTQKIAQLVPADAEHYYSFDWKTGEDKTFATESECRDFQRSADATLCRPVPRVKSFETEDARKEAEAKGAKGKKGR